MGRLLDLVDRYCAMPDQVKEVMDLSYIMLDTIREVEKLFC
jgi:hypothetical protein